MKLLKLFVNCKSLMGNKYTVYMYMSNLVVSLWLLLVSVQERLREAAKQQIRRWIAPHKKKKNLEAPSFVKDQWAQSDQNGMGQLLMDCNFQKEQSL